MARTKYSTAAAAAAAAEHRAKEAAAAEAVVAETVAELLSFLVEDSVIPVTPPPPSPLTEPPPPRVKSMTISLTRPPPANVSTLDELNTVFRRSLNLDKLDVLVVHGCTCTWHEGPCLFFKYEVEPGDARCMHMIPRMYDEMTMAAMIKHIGEIKRTLRLTPQEKELAKHILAFNFNGGMTMEANIQALFWCMNVNVPQFIRTGTISDTATYAHVRYRWRSFTTDGPPSDEATNVFWQGLRPPTATKRLKRGV